MKPSHSFAEAHSFAKNANEWGTRPVQASKPSEARQLLPITYSVFDFLQSRLGCLGVERAFSAALVDNLL